MNAIEKLRLAAKEEAKFFAGPRVLWFGDHSFSNRPPFIGGGPVDGAECLSAVQRLWDAMASPLAMILRDGEGNAWEWQRGGVSP